MVTNTEAAAEQIKKNLPDAEEFTQALGQISWLLTLSKEHREKPITYIESHISTALMFKQARVYTKGKQPIGAILWAYASEEIKQKIETPGYQMTLADWRSGQEVIVVDCISPLMDGQIFIDQFHQSMD